MEHEELLKCVSKARDFMPAEVAQAYGASDLHSIASHRIAES